MTPTTPVPVLGVCFVGLVALLSMPACSPQVLPLGPDAQTVAFDAIASTTTVAALTDAQATTVCNWLIDVSPIAMDKPPSVSKGGIIPAGFVNGAAIGGEFCPGASPAGASWPLLDASDCVLNLRHSPCAASLSTVKACVTSLAAYFSGGAGSCFGPSAACATYWSDPACTQTIFQTAFGGSDALCSTSLPIEAGVICVEPGSTDAGAE